MRLYQWESEAARAREDAARPGKPYRIGAEKLSRLAGFNLDEKRLSQLALVFHYGLALQWAPLYPLLRRRTQLAPLPAGLLTGTAMSLLADELMTPAFGFSAPNLDYPPRLPTRHPCARLPRSPGLRDRRCGRGRDRLGSAAPGTAMTTPPPSLSKTPR